jgi:site-specific recombinase XerD
MGAKSGRVCREKTPLLKPATSSPALFVGRHGEAMTRQNFWQRLGGIAQIAEFVPKPILELQL